MLFLGCILFIFHLLSCFEKICILCRSMLYKEIFNFSECSFPNPNFIRDVFQISSFIFTTDFLNFSVSYSIRFFFLLEEINFCFLVCTLFEMNYSHQSFSLYLVNI